jgi:hypothetical protein
LNVVLKAGPGATPAAIQWTMNDPGSSVLGFVAAVGPVASSAGKIISCSGSSCLLYGLDARPIPDGVVAVLTFPLAGQPSSQVTFQFTDALAATPDANPISVSTSSALISVGLDTPVFPDVIAANLSMAGSAAQLAGSGGWDTGFHLINTSSRTATARLQLFHDDGSPFAGPLALTQNAALPITIWGASVDQTLAAGATTVVDVPNADDSQTAQIGSAHLFTGGNIGGFLRLNLAGGDQEAALPLETRQASSYILAFDNTGGTAVGVAIANLMASPTNVTVVIRDSSGAQIDSANISLLANGHWAFTLHQQFPSTLNVTGSIEFDTSSSGSISVLGIRFQPSGRFTTIPVVSGTDPFAGSWAHLAVGGGWTTYLQLINAGNTAAQAHVKFYDDNGADLALPFAPSDTALLASQLDPVLPPNGTLEIQSMAWDDSPLQTGSARLSSDGAVTGFIRFRYNPRDEEAIVPLERGNETAYFLAFDNTNQLATGVAVANMAAITANIPVTIRDSSGTLLGTELLTIAPGGHISFVLSDCYGESANQSGTVEFATPIGGQISVLGLRFLPSGSFSTIPLITP